MSQEKGNDSKEGDEQNHKSDEIRLAKHLPNVSRVSGTLLIGVETIFGAFKILLIPCDIVGCDFAVLIIHHRKWKAHHRDEAGQ